MISNSPFCRLEALGLSTPVYNALIRAGLRTVGDVMRLTEPEISALKWMPADGPKEILTELKHIGCDVSLVSHGGIAAQASKHSSPHVDEVCLPAFKDFYMADNWISESSNVDALRSIAVKKGLSFCYLVGKLPIAVRAIRDAGKEFTADCLLHEMEWYAGELASDFMMLHGETE